MTILETQEPGDSVKDLFEQAVAIETQARTLSHLGYDIDWREVRTLEKHAFSMRKHHDRRHRHLTGGWHRGKAELYAKLVQHYIDRFHQQRGAQMAA